MNDTYNRILVIFFICILTGWLAYLDYDVTAIVSLQEKLVYLAGVYIVGKEVTNVQEARP